MKSNLNECCNDCYNKEPLCHLECKTWRTYQEKECIRRSEKWRKATWKWFYRHPRLSSILLFIICCMVVFGLINSLYVLGEIIKHR